MLITGVITACSCNTLKPKALPRRARGRTGLVQFPLAQFSETSKAERRSCFCLIGVVAQGRSSNASFLNLLPLAFKADSLIDWLLQTVCRFGNRHVHE